MMLAYLLDFMMRFIAAVALGVVTALVLVSAIQALDTPYCPTEESCAYQYEDGHASVVEVTP